MTVVVEGIDVYHLYQVVVDDGMLVDIDGGNDTGGWR